jgi:hypothetical protein
VGVASVTRLPLACAFVSAVRVIPVPFGPAVPTVAMTAVSALLPVSMVIVWPGANPSTLVTLIVVAPTRIAPARVVAADA